MAACGIVVCHVALQKSYVFMWQCQCTRHVALHSYNIAMWHCSSHVAQVASVPSPHGAEMLKENTVSSLSTKGF